MERSISVVEITKMEDWEVRREQRLNRAARVKTSG